MSILFSVAILTAVKLPGVLRRAAPAGRGVECCVDLDGAGTRRYMSRADWERWSCQFATAVHRKRRCSRCAPWHSLRVTYPSVLRYLAGSSLIVSQVRARSGPALGP